jgi:Uma2 family endonuclease
VVVVEFVFPGSRRTDHVTKRGEYADAGIPHYWIVDLTDPISLLACHLAGEFGYADDGGATHTFRASTPFPVQLDLDGLR